MRKKARVRLGLYCCLGLSLVAITVDKTPAAAKDLMSHGPGPTIVRQHRGAQVGIASWYGSEHRGRPTASGRVFDPHKLTAAHNSLPLNTRARVVNLENGKSVEVTINDRGPGIPGRVIDLSERAAKRLGMRKQGLALVLIEPLPMRVAYD
ncbi:MAG TPA: septal ring lytic transglycosylase RlpA family protein [Stellaceae bacterium]|nr:septal ring lytic transglycosylase RlpA family protein [Stellaceae bacterium]